MRTWDLTTGTAKLEQSVDSLNLAWTEASAHWDDETQRAFQKNHLEQFQPRVQRALDAMHRISQVFAKAQRECDDT